MTPLIRLLFPCVAFSLGMSLAARADDPTVMMPKKVLFFSKSTGFIHSVIQDPPTPFTPRPGSEIPGLAFKVLKELGAKNNIEFTFSKDGSLFNPDYLAQFDAFCFYTSGDLTERGNDGNPPMTAAGKAAFLHAIKSGKGFVGMHAATDTFHSPGGKDHGPARFQPDGANADEYVRMIGGEFIQHGQQQLSHLIVVDPRFPGVSAVPEDNSFREEWYSLKNFSPELHVLLVQDTSGMKGIEYARPNYPSTWAKMYGKGRVFYTSLGHRDDIWQGKMFQTLIVGALNWATGRVDADVTPNIDTAAPEANVLPKYVPRPPKTAN